MKIPTKYLTLPVAAALTIFAAGLVFVAIAGAVNPVEKRPKMAPGRWVSVQPPNSLMSDGVVDGRLCGFSAKDIYFGAHQGFLLHYDGLNWRKVKVAPSGSATPVCGGPGFDLFALNAGWDHPDFGLDGGWIELYRILHLENGKWVVIDICGDDVWPHDPITGIWAASKSDIFLVTGGGEILHYDGKRWSRMIGPPRPWYGPGPRREGPWPALATNLYAIWGTSGDNVYAVGTDVGIEMGKALRGVVLHYDGTKWAKEATPPMADPRDISGSSASDIWIAPDMLHFDGVKWSKTNHEGAWGANRVWTYSPSTVFAVGSGIYFYDGKEWSVMDNPSGKDLWGVWGSSPSDVWAVGDGSTILHYTGKAGGQ